MLIIKNVTKDAVLYMKGNLDTTSFLVKSGSFFVNESDYLEAFENKLYVPGNILGYRSALIGLPKYETVIAKEDSSVIPLQNSQILQILENRVHIGLTLVLEEVGLLKKLSEMETFFYQKIDQSNVSREISQDRIFLALAKYFYEKKDYSNVDLMKNKFIEQKATKSMDSLVEKELVQLIKQMHSKSFKK